MNPRQTACVMQNDSLISITQLLQELQNSSFRGEQNRPQSLYNQKIKIVTLLKKKFTNLYLQKMPPFAIFFLYADNIQFLYIFLM